MLTRRIRVALAATAIGGLAAAGFTSLAPGAVAAPVALDFTCSVSILTGQAFKLTVEPQLPAVITVGRAVEAKFSGSVTVPHSTVSAAHGLLNVRSLKGAAAVSSRFGTDSVTLEATLPETSLPATGELSVPVSGKGTWTPTGLGAAVITIPSFTAPLTMTKADRSTSDVVVDCRAVDAAKSVASANVTAVPVTPPPTSVPPTSAPSAAPTATPTTPPSAAPTTEPAVTPAPAASRASVRVKHSKARKRVGVTARVTVAGKSATGRVKVTLKRAGKTVTSVTKPLAKGTAKAAFTKVSKKGKYKVIVTYVGDAKQAGSSMSARFTVR